MKRKEIEEIRKRADAATPGPWDVRTNQHCECSGEQWGWIKGPCDNWCWTDKYKRSRANAEFVAHSREDVPALLDEIERLCEENRWIPVGEKLPTEKDADRTGYVYTWNKSYNIPLSEKWYSVPHQANITHWRPTPKGPEGEETE